MPSFILHQLSLYFLAIADTVGQNMRPIKSHMEEKSEAQEENMNVTQDKWLRELRY